MMNWLRYCLSLFSVLFAASILVPSATWSYDAQTLQSISYDEVSFSGFNYDSEATLSAKEKANGFVGMGSVFANFAEFLAAEGTPVFWSGGRAAEDAARTFANANNGIVIGDTAAGRALAQSTAGVPWSQARPQWLNLSENFARSASGEVNVFQNARGVAVDSIWRNEYQILRQNNVQINFNVVMPKGSVAPVP